MRRWSILAFLCSAMVLRAQDAGVLKGRVVDNNDAPLAGAEVTLRAPNGLPSRAVTDAAGEFSLPLPASLAGCTFDVEKPGYFAMKGRRIPADSSPRDLRFVLNRLQEVTESLNVSGVSSPLELDRTAPVQRLSGVELIELPGTTSDDLRNSMSLLPGVIQDNQGGVHLNGGAEDQILYTLNGFNITDPLTSHFESRLGADAVQSLETISGNLPAQYGKGSSGVVAVNTRMGDNRWSFSSTNFLPGVENRKGLVIGSWAPRIYASGPIVPSRVWFSNTFTTDYDKGVVRGLPAGQDQNTSWRFGDMMRVQANLTPSQILFADFLANIWIAPLNGLGPLDPIQTTVDRRSRQYFGGLKDQIYFSNGGLLEVGFALNRVFSREIPQGHNYYLFTPFGREGNYFVDGAQKGGRNQYLANYFTPTFRWLGSHQIKAGVDLDNVDFWQDLSRTGFVDYRADGTPARQVVYFGNGVTGRENFEASSFVEDSWRARPGLFFQLGIREDWDQILRNWNLAPRAGFAWAPFRSETTKISGGYGLVYDETALDLFTRPDGQYPVTTFFPAGNAAAYSTAAYYTIDRRHFQTPRYRSLNLGIDHKFPHSLFVQVTGLTRRGDYGLVYQDPPVSSTESRYSLEDARRDRFRSVGMTIRQNLHKQYMWMIGYTRSFSHTNAVFDLSPDQPLIVSRNAGPLPWDSPNRFRGWGILPTPFPKWSLAYRAEYHSGFPFSIQDDIGRVLGNPNSTRFPVFYEINLAAERQIALRGQLWALRLGVDNITNHINPNAVNNDSGSPEFLRFYGDFGRSYNFRIRWLGKLP